MGAEADSALSVSSVGFGLGRKVAEKVGTAILAAIFDAVASVASGQAASALNNRFGGGINALGEEAISKAIEAGVEHFKPSSSSTRHR